jgi:hypothetical protein
MSQLPAEASRYVVAASPDVVEVWSSFRLPFEPTSSQQGLRTDLRAALAALTFPGDALLRATYASAGRDFCDVENVLLYNVGPAAFAHLVRRGVWFERSYAPPPPMPIPEWQAKHYYRYEPTADGDASSGWLHADLLADFAGIALPAITKPHAVWLAVREQAPQPVGRLTVPGPFAVDLVLTPPRRWASSGLGGVVKPLLDGLISAYHGHDGQQIDEIVSRLAARLRRPGAALAEMLVDDSWAALGRRRLLWPYREFVQWSPADDLCVAARVVLSPPGPSDTWTITGSIHAVTARTAGDGSV